MYYYCSPPCRHLSMEQLQEQGKARRNLLPRHTDGPGVCPEFQTLGYCSLFNKYGKCNLDHPLYLHKVVPIPKRCPVCTLVWPCKHCKFSTEREKLGVILENVKNRCSLLLRMAVPNPPMALVGHLVSLLFFLLVLHIFI